MKIVLRPCAFHTAALSTVVIVAATCAVAQTASTGPDPALSPSKGQVYPGKPIRIVAGQSPGGATDLFARMFSQKLNEAWKNPVVVENRPGASGAIAAEITARSPPDGYTLLLATAGQIVINQNLNRKLGYDPLKDLAPVVFLVSSSLMLVTHPSVPAKSVRELVALAKAHPNKLNHGSGGSGSPAHLAAELFKAKTGVKMTHVPFKGVGPGVAALVSGEIDLTFASVAATLPQVKASRLRALAVSTPKRSQAAPDIPTVAEAGVPGYEVTTWYGMFGPAALPRQIVSRLNAEFTRILGLPDVRERLLNDGAEPGNLTLDQFAAFIRADAERWAKVIKDAGVKAD